MNVKSEIAGTTGVITSDCAVPYLDDSISNKILDYIIFFETVFISNNSQIIRVRILFGHRSGNQNQSTPFHFGLICRSPEVNMVPTKL